jgi:hypothetical protein
LFHSLPDFIARFSPAATKQHTNSDGQRAPMQHFQLQKLHIYLDTCLCLTYDHWQLQAGKYGTKPVGHA